MGIDSFASIAQVVEAVILVASVFYLSMQVKQANKMSMSETRRTLLKMDIDDIAVGRDNPEIITLWTKEELSPEERITFAGAPVLATLGDERNTSFCVIKDRNGFIRNITIQTSFK